MLEACARCDLCGRSGLRSCLAVVQTTRTVKKKAPGKTAVLQEGETAADSPGRTEEDAVLSEGQTGALQLSGGDKERRRMQRVER